jgi:hypothetical protein
MTYSLLFHDYTTHGNVLTDVVHKLFCEPFGQQLIGELKFNETSSPSPLMDVIRYMSAFVMFEGSQNLGPRVITDQ